MGKSTISMAIFNGYVNLPEGSIDSWWMIHVTFRVRLLTAGTPPTRSADDVQ